MEIPLFSIMPGFENLPFGEQMRQYKAFVDANDSFGSKELRELVDTVCKKEFKSEMEAMMFFLDGAEKMMSNATPSQRRFVDRVQHAEYHEMGQIAREYVAREGSEVARTSSEHSRNAK